MAWLNALLKGLAVVAIAHISSCAASPLAEPRDDTLRHYLLKVSTGDNKSLNGRYLAINETRVGVYPGNTNLQVYPVASAATKGQYELHTWPIGIIDHALALTGDTGLLPLTDIIPRGEAAGGSSAPTPFKLTGGTGASSHGQVVYTGDSLGGGWVAFPASGGAWTVDWYDGTAVVTLDYVPIKINYVLPAASDSS